MSPGSARAEPGWTVETHSPEETLDLGRRIARAARPGDVLALVGELGAGKTVLAKGLAEGLGAAEAREVVSPTFVLCREYLRGRIPLYHFDAYRLRGGADLEQIGAPEIFGGDGLSAVEWADRAPQVLPADHLEVRLEVTGEQSRRLVASAGGPASERWLGEIRRGAVGLDSSMGGMPAAAFLATPHAYATAAKACRPEELLGLRNSALGTRHFVSRFPCCGSN